MSITKTQNQILKDIKTRGNKYMSTDMTTTDDPFVNLRFVDKT